MKTILQIDHHYLLLPESANINTLVKMLAQSKKVDRDYGRYGDTYTVDGDPKIEVKIVQDKHVLNPKDRRRIPLKASADCHGPGL